MTSVLPQRYIRIIVHGKVQGVFFRKYTLKKAIEFNVKGFVKNQSDNSVLIEAIADNENLNSFINFCKTGPPRAEVKLFQLEELLQAPNFSSFRILNNYH